MSTMETDSRLPWSTSPRIPSLARPSLWCVLLTSARLANAQLYGQSIGGAVVLDTAAAFPDMVAGIIIENTFVSLETLVPHVMPAIPQLLVSLLLSERWDAGKVMPKIPKATPVLFLSGKRDELVPQGQMIKLRELRGDGKYRWHEYPQGTHNDTYVTPQYWEDIGEWLNDEITGKSKEKQ